MTTLTLRPPKPTAFGLFEGVGGFSLGLERAGWKMIGHVERDKYCQQVLRRHWPDLPIFPDVTEVTGDAIREACGETPTLICGGFPCFPAGTMVRTAKGDRPIQEIEVGDAVLTHNHRLRPVVETMSRGNAELYEVRALGTGPIKTTAEHPFYARTSRGVAATWVAAEDLKRGAFVALPLDEADNVEQVGARRSYEYAYMVGRWLGDGWIVDHPRTSTVPQGQRGSRVDSRVHKAVICCAYEEAEVLAEAIDLAGYHATRSDERTVVKFHISSESLVEELRYFGRGAASKHLDEAVFKWGAEALRGLWDGYIDADGCVLASGAVQVTSVSERLIKDMARVARALFRRAPGVYRVEVPETTVIEGRVVNQQTQWQLRLSPTSNQQFVADGFLWVPVRSVTKTGERQRVFNIGVQGDESYCAEGVVVHNCQDISLAGHRRGLDGERSGLWWEFHRILSEVRPEYCVIENVGGLLSSSGGRDLGAILGALGDLGYGYAYRVLDSRYFGVPQRRRRVFIVGSLGHWGHPGEVLLEPEGGGWDPAPGREEGAQAARATALRSPRQGVTRGSELGRAIDGGREVGALTKSLGEGGPDAAHAFANWLVGGSLTPIHRACGLPLEGEPACRCQFHGDEPMGSPMEDVVYAFTPSVAPQVFNVYPVSTAIARNMLTARPTEEAEALTASFAKCSDRGDLVLQAYPVAVRGRADGAEVEQGEEGTFFALRAGDGGSSRAQWVVVRAQGLVFRKLHRATSVEDAETWSEAEVANTLNTYDEGDVRTTHAIISIRMLPEMDPDVVRTLTSHAGRYDLDTETFPVVSTAVPGELAVRRLLPVETERLQAFPDGHTEWGLTEDGRRVEVSDTQRYKMMGNAVTTLVPEWIGRRLYDCWWRDVV